MSNGTNIISGKRTLGAKVASQLELRLGLPSRSLSIPEYSLNINYFNGQTGDVWDSPLLELCQKYNLNIKNLVIIQKSDNIWIDIPIKDIFISAVVDKSDVVPFSGNTYLIKFKDKYIVREFINNKQVL